MSVDDGVGAANKTKTCTTKHRLQRTLGTTMLIVTYLRVHRLGNMLAGKKATMIRAQTASFHSSSRV